MLFGLPAFTMITRCDFMYVTAAACFKRSGVTKMPLITASQRFAFSAGIRPGNAVFEATAVPPQVAASFVAMSTSKPMILPLVVVYSIGGNAGAGGFLHGVLLGRCVTTANQAAAVGPDMGLEAGARVCGWLAGFYSSSGACTLP